MGNCHARFGAGENPEERICSLRLHIPPNGLPIAIIFPISEEDARKWGEKYMSVGEYESILGEVEE